MRINIASVVPELIKGFFDYSITKRVIDKQLVEVYFHSLHDYANNTYRQVGDYRFDGGAGMMMMIEFTDRCISTLKTERTYDEVIFLTPDGDTPQQKTANKLSLSENLTVLCRYFKEVNQHVRNHLITREVFIGDYVPPGDELGAAILCDVVARLIPGVLSDKASTLVDSFQDSLLTPPVYTRSANYEGWKVPGVLTSGNILKTK